jgi:hypothetical protein
MLSRAQSEFFGNFGHPQACHRNEFLPALVFRDPDKLGDNRLKNLREYPQHAAECDAICFARPSSQP